MSTPVIYTLSLHDALPILTDVSCALRSKAEVGPSARTREGGTARTLAGSVRCNHTHYTRDRKSTRLNSSHLGISYAVFCLKKKKRHGNMITTGRCRSSTFL